MSLVLGVDVGSQSVKVVLVNDDAKIICHLKKLADKEYNKLHLDKAKGNLIEPSFLTSTEKSKTKKSTAPVVNETGSGTPAVGE